MKEGKKKRRTEERERERERILYYHIRTFNISLPHNMPTIHNQESVCTYWVSLAGRCLIQSSTTTPANEDAICIKKGTKQKQNKFSSTIN